MPETTYDHLLTDVAAKICTITLNRPEKLNAVNSKLCSELDQALDRADQDGEVNVIVLKGAGRAFCSGHDLDQDAEEERTSIYEYRQHYVREFDEFTKIWRISTPVIASVHGYAIGKGFEWSLMADVSIVSEEVRMGLGEMRYGIPAITLLMPWFTGIKSCKEMILTGLDVPAAEARERGLITTVVKREDLEAETARVAQIMARMPRDMQKMHKQYLHGVYETQGFWKSQRDYLEALAILGACPVPEYEQFSRTTAEKGLKAALAEANARFEGLYR